MRSVIMTAFHYNFIHMSVVISHLYCQYCGLLLREYMLVCDESFTDSIDRVKFLQAIISRDQLQYITFDQWIPLYV